MRGETGPEDAVPPAGRPGGTLPRLHVIAPGAVLTDRAFARRAGRLAEACGSDLAIHLRARELTGRSLYELALELSRQAEAHGGWCVVNGRPDVARAAGAQAVQLGRSAPPLRAVHPWLGDRLRAGVSVHGAGEALRAAADGANYLVLGTIYPTPSHPGQAGGGPPAVARVTRALRRAPRAAPVVAIGGIRADRVAEVRHAGAAGVAVLRAVWDAQDPAAAAREILDAFEARE